jgi:hypothetical protein
VANAVNQSVQKVSNEIPIIKSEDVKSDVPSSEPKARKNFPVVVKLNPYKGEGSEETKDEKQSKKVRFKEETDEPVAFGQIESIVLPGCSDLQNPKPDELKQLQVDHENP